MVAAFAAEGLSASPRRAQTAPVLPAWTVFRFPAAAERSPDADDARRTIRALVDRIPVRAPPAGPATCLIINCGAPNPDAFALALARACLASERSTLLIELSARAGKVAHGLARDLPVGAVKLDAGENAIGILAGDDKGRNLVIVPGAAGQRDLRAPTGVSSEVRRFGAADEFDVVVAYAPHARATPAGTRPAAASDVIVILVSEAMTPDQRAFVDGLMAIASERCAVVAQAA